MTARRRRVGSESDQTSQVVTYNVPHSSQDSWVTQAFAVAGNETEEKGHLGNSPVRGKQNTTSKAMTAKDRTNEFRNAICSLQGRHVTRAVAIQDPKKAKYIQSYAEFMMIARTIGKNIGSTYAKLEKLTLLAKKKSLFNDRPTEIQDLTYIIKEDLNSLNQQIARLQKVAKVQRSHQNQHLLTHSSSVVVALQSKLASMSTEFKQVLEVRTENLKQQKSRQEQFTQGPVSCSLPPSAISGYHQGSVLLAEEQVAVNMDETRPLIPASQKQAVIYDETDNYLQTRAETMQNIESTIIELGGIYQQLAHMVKEQEEMVQRIDANVQDVEMNVEAAHSEIIKYFQNITSNRWLMIKIFAILIFFFFFFVIFLA